ncbi:MAG: chromosome segregation protein SMC [Gemmataceae bacterium]|nr:chromosome segregation protein SMC [Gemmataceae bacterium]
MLKRLELVGFKSFAEKTGFDFGDGVTAIVGPNGSGKSNIIDSVRWVLGEQSAKSLRGGEMTDVIFNGSTSRRSLGLAEVTMTFDNCRRLLATDAEEVQVTRRVYRDGQGEYLINQQPCRLKDVKDLFLGSGAGGGAYCIIEQGRVDVLLQASNRERRIIFEEAAGLSRFKARKIETLRKLERVDQNLQRLRDILDEVEKQLRSVKLQAAKAQRYQEYSGRLRELRVGLGLQEYHALTERLAAETAVLEGLRTALKDRAEQAAAWEADMQRLEAALAALDEQVREQDGRLSAAREQIRAGQTTLGHEAVLSADLEAELARTRARLAELNARVAALAESAGRAREELLGVETQVDEQRETARVLEEGLETTVRRLAALNDQRQADKDEHLEQMRRSALLQNDAVSYKAQIDNLSRERDRLRHRTEQAAENLASLDVELQELEQADGTLQGRLAASRQALAERREERDRLGRLRDETTELLSDLRQQRSGLASRVEVLEGLERSHEGLGTGVREVFALLEKPDAGPWRTVLGMIADFLTVRREHAALIDLALGEWAQRFLVRDAGQLADALAQRGQPFSGRVSFLPLRPAPHGAWPTDGSPDAPRPNRLIEGSLLGRVRMPISAEGTPAHPGVIAAAEALVRCDHSELLDLPAQLLGRTLIVRDLATARAIAAHTTGYRLVTLQGELLEPDGTLTVGTHHAEAGILSRKSELRELRQQLAALDRRIVETERDLADLRDRLVDLDRRASEQTREIEVLAEQAADLRARLERHRDRRQGLHEEVAVSRDEIQRVEQEIGGLQGAWQKARDEAAAAEARVQELAARVHQADVEIRAREEERQRQQQQGTLAKVALGKVEERLASLQAQHGRLETDLRQRQQERDEAEQGARAGRARLVESQRTMLQASADLARVYLDKEAAERQVADLSAARAGHRQERVRLANQAQTVRAEWRAQQEQAHARELEVSDLRHRRDSLCDRLREDYQLELSQLYEEGAGEVPPHGARPVGLSADTEQVNEEIAELRRKLSRLGSVNLDSLQELSELETRSTSLQAQYDDLTAAKRSLEEIIDKINQDSRRLFTDTFATIRTHFQELFRKLFGGGMADIVLEDENDVLECGIEIIARPPGKELRSISLMSGGEKTMTAVGLLLAIFRSKPSPFCILDEVDAALDEANIGRFTAVLREVLEQSQFIIITHSKRTMACADVLYGITMQESGVSKRVAVRFEDWEEEAAPTNGEIPLGEFGGK